MYENSYHSHYYKNNVYVQIISVTTPLNDIDYHYKCQYKSLYFFNKNCNR